VEYHANGGGGSWHANRRKSGQLSFEGSWILHFDAQSVKMQPVARACAPPVLLIMVYGRAKYEFVAETYFWYGFFRFTV